jgi:transcription initiation factor IIE alpha subunit
MTAFGKMLVIFVFLLSITWAGFSIVTFVTRTNWRAESNKNLAIANDNYKGAEGIKKQEIVSNDDNRSSNAALMAEVERLKEDLKSEKAISKNVTDAYEKKLASDRKNDATIIGLQANIKSLQDQAALNDQQLKDSNTALDTMTRKAKDAEAKMEDAILEAKSFKQQSERLTTRVQEFADKLAELRQGGGTNLLTGSPPAPENFRGTVRAYKDGFVEITPGLNSGLRAGTILKIQRLEGGGKFVGYLTVGADLNPDKAVGTWTQPAGVKKPTADDLPKVGDEVVPTK